MSEDAPVLEFVDVVLSAGHGYDSGLLGVNLRIARGELALAVAERHESRIPLADAAEGLLEPDSGSVRFLGEDWSCLGPDCAAAARWRIGRVFHGPAWVSNLDVDENVMLKEVHHSRRALAEIEQEAAALAAVFGLESLPHKRPALLNRAELCRAQWVRAMLGQPALLLLEFPEHETRDAIVSAAAESVRQALDRGAAVLCVTATPDDWRDHGLKAAAKYRIVDGRWTKEE
jgi:phospholipid/cholesterol/gamma-HCH transport system ATP-binding protein